MSVCGQRWDGRARGPGTPDFPVAVGEVAFRRLGLTLALLTFVLGNGRARASVPDPPHPEAPAGLVRWWPNPWNAREVLSGRMGVVMGILPETGSEDTDPRFGEETGWVQLRPPLPSGPFTLALWVRSLDGYHAPMLSQQAGARSWRIVQQSHRGSGAFVAGPGSPDDPEGFDGFVLTPEVWHHLVIAQRPDRTLRIWVDGLPTLDGTTSRELPPETEWLCLGNDPKGDGTWRGHLRDVRVYNRVLSDGEVRELHGRGLPPPAPLLDTTPRAARLGSPWLTTVSNLNTAPLDVLYRRYTAEDGLPANSVQCVLQGRSGHLWVGTELGLTRFDGRSFRVFDEGNTPALATLGSDISCLAESEDGTLWAGVYGGLLRARGTEFTAFTNGLPERFILRAVPDRDGTVWVAGFSVNHTDRGICRVRRYDPVTQTSLSEVPLPGQPRHLLPGRAGLWMATEEPNAIWLWREDWETPVRVASILPTAPWIRVTARLSEFPGVTLRAGTGNEGELQWVEFQPEAGLPGFVYRIQRGSLPIAPNPWSGPPSTPLWIAGRTGLSRVDAEGTRAVRIPGAIQAPRIECLTANREGGIWFGTSEDGLHLVRERSVTLLTTADGLPSDDVRSVSLASDGTLWVATRNGPARRGSGTTGWETVASYRGISVIASHGGLPLVASTGFGEDALWGLFQGGPPAPVLPGLPWKFPTSLHPARDGSVWVACDLGLTRLGPSLLRSDRHPSDTDAATEAEHRHWVRWRVGHEIPQTVPIGVVQDRDGSIWCGSKGAGLLHVRTNGVGILTLSDGLPSLHCAALLAEDDGSIWLITEAGLARRRDGRFAVLDPEKGLPDRAIAAMITDRQGNYWLGGQRGIHRLARSEVEAVLAGEIPRLTSLTLGVAEGLRTPECSIGVQPAIARTPDGRIWVATRGGLASLDPESIQGRLQPTETWIESLRANGDDIDLRPAGNRSPGPAQPVLLPPGSGTGLEIEFSAVSLNDAAALRFRYRLDGHDRDWSPTTDRRFAVYTNLRPGPYRFRVQATRWNDRWHPEETVLPFHIQPHFWETPSFRLLTVLSAAALIGLLHRRRLVGLRRFEQLRRQEALASERARIAADLHDDLGAALTQISMFGELAKAKSPADSPARRALDRALEVSRETTARMGDLIWSTNPDSDSLDQLIAHLREQVARQLDAAGKTFLPCFPDTVPKCHLSAIFRRNLLLVVKEAVHNALKHGDADRIEVTVDAHPAALSIRIADNGCGFVPAVRAHAGHGLNNMRRRILELGGQFELTAAPGNGTRVALQVPLPRS
ncbi:MAG: hypothetical protein KF833_20180 [Verrucomicrobiae bacterium]|nr:hypothetical protein [Verrucomicrobiae bacterium]